MHVFVTGANGHIGSAVVADLLDAGHRVLGLARSASGVDVVRRLGAEALRGDVDDLDLIRDAAQQTDAPPRLRQRGRGGRRPGRRLRRRPARRPSLR